MIPPKAVLQRDLTQKKGVDDHHWTGQKVQSAVFSAVIHSRRLKNVLGVNNLNPRKKKTKTKTPQETVPPKTAPSQSQRDREIIAHLELLMMLELLSDYELFDESPP